MPRLGQGVLPLCFLGALTAFAPLTGEAQEESRWFGEVRTGWSSAIAPGNAYDGGPSAGIGVGVAVKPAVRLRFSLGIDDLPYSDERFGELFVMADSRPPDAGALSVSAVGLTGGVEWSPGMFALVRPWLGAGLTFRSRSSMSSFVVSVSSNSRHS